MAWAASKVPRLNIRMRIFFVLSVEPEGRPSVNNLLGSVGGSLHIRQTTVLVGKRGLIDDAATRTGRYIEL